MARNKSFIKLEGTIAYVFNRQGAIYKPLEAAFNGVKKKTLSLAYAIDMPVDTPMDVSVEVTDSEEDIPTDVTLMGAIRILCYQEIDGALYKLVQGRSMRVAVVA